MGGDGVSAEASMKNDEVLRIVLVGKTGAGKSSSGNTILGCITFKSEMSGVSVTDKCEMKKGSVAFRNISVVDTPGLFDTRFTEDETTKKISDCISLSAPGPHAFLLVIKLDRFTAEEQRSVEIIQKVFGQESDKYTMVLFTNGDQLKGQPVEAFLKDCPKLQELVTKCKGGYHVFNNESKHPCSQVEELMVKINQMVRENGGSHYTNAMFQEAARKIKEEKERERREKEEKRRAEREELKNQLREEVRKELKRNLRNEVIEKEKEKARRRRVFGIATGVAVPTGVAVGAAVGTFAIEGAVAGALGGPIGLAIGAVVGAGIGGGYMLYKYFKKRNKNTTQNHTEESEPLIDNEQPTPEGE